MFLEGMEELFEIQKIVNVLSSVNFSEISNRQNIYQFSFGDIVCKVQNPSYYDVNWFLNKLMALDPNSENLIEEIAPILEVLFIKVSINIDDNRSDILFYPEGVDKEIANQMIAHLFYILMFLVVRQTKCVEKSEYYSFVEEFKRVKIEKKSEMFDVFDFHDGEISNNSFFFKYCPNEFTPC